MVIEAAREIRKTCTDLVGSRGEELECVEWPRGPALVDLFCPLHDGESQQRMRRSRGIDSPQNAATCKMYTCEGRNVIHNISPEYSGGAGLQ